MTDEDIALADESDYEDVTVRLNLRLKPHLAEEEISRIVSIKSQEIRDAIQNHCHRSSRSRSLLLPKGVQKRRNNDLPIGQSDELPTQQSSQYQIEAQPATSTLTGELSFVYEQGVSTPKNRSLSTQNKRKRTAADGLVQKRLRLSLDQLSEQFAIAVESGGQAFHDNTDYQTTWLSNTDVTRPCGKHMSLCELDLAYETYTSSSALHLQRARLIQCFLALATARKGGRPLGKEQQPKTPEIKGCSKTKLRRANVGRVLIELMNMLPKSRAHNICVALAAVPQNHDVIGLGRHLTRREHGEVARNIKRFLDRPDRNDTWHQLGTRYSFDPVYVISATDLPYDQARIRLNLHNLDSQDTRSLPASETLAFSGETSCMLSDDSQHGESQPYVTTNDNGYQHSRTDALALAVDWSDMVELGVGFDLSVPSIDGDFVDRTTLAGGTGNNCLPNSTIGSLFESTREYNNQALATTGSPRLGGATGSTGNCWWQEIQSLGIDVYPAAEDTFQYSAVSLPVIRNE